MRRIGICEERGSGWDRVVFQCELGQLPAPLAELAGRQYARCTIRATPAVQYEQSRTGVDDLSARLLEHMSKRRLCDQQIS